MEVDKKNVAVTLNITLTFEIPLNDEEWRKFDRDHYQKVIKIIQMKAELELIDELRKELKK